MFQILKFLIRMLYAWVCFICVMHEFRSEMYHTQGVRTTLDDLTSYVIQDSIGAKVSVTFSFVD